MSAAAPDPVRVISAGIQSAGAFARIHGISFDEPWSETAFADILAMPGAFALVAVPEERAETTSLSIEGFVLARVAADEAEILTIAVDLPCRGRGVGRRLVEGAAVSARAAGALALFLEVAEDNHPALHLYERLGFRTVGIRPDYYARGATRVAARAMRLDLP